MKKEINLSDSRKDATTDVVNRPDSKVAYHKTTKTTMGKAKTWLAEEHAALAQAWINASEDKDRTDVKGTNQDGNELFFKLWKISESMLRRPALPADTTTER